MLNFTDRMSHVADLTKLLHDLVSQLSQDPKLRENDDIAKIVALSKRLAEYVEQTIRGDRTSAWFSSEAMSLRGELGRLTNRMEVKGGQLPDLRSISFHSANNTVSNIEDIKNQLAVIGVEDSEYSRYFLKIAHTILDEIDSITSFSDANPYKSKIVRTIKPKKEHSQVVLSILNYFGRIIKQKKPEIDIRVKTEQIGDEIIFVAEFNHEYEEDVDTALYEYGLVVTDRKRPADFMDNNIHAMELKHKLELATLELKQTTELLYAERHGYSARIEFLEKEVDWLRQTFDNGLNRQDEIQAILNKIAIGNSESLRRNLEFIARKMVSGLKQSDEKLVKERLIAIAKEDVSVLRRLGKFATDVMTASGSKILSDWISSLRHMLP